MTDVQGIGPDPHRAPRLELAGAYAAGAFRVLPQVLLAPRAPRALLDHLVRRRLAGVTRHARASCPYYREALRGVDLEGLARDGDASRLPLLDKPTLRDHGDALLADGVEPSTLAWRSSSGSSGVPTRVAFDPIRELPRRVQELRLLRAHGVSLTDRQLVFDHPRHLSAKRFLPQRLGLWRREPYPWQRPIEEGLAFIEGERFEVLHGVLSSLRLLALAVRRRGGLRYRPKLLVSKGELLDGGTRALVEDALRAPLSDCYATEEVGIVAWQAPGETGHRIDADLVHVEVVDPVRGRPLPPGEIGEIVVTNLYMRAMPILRYRTGDLGAIDPSPPRGMALPRLLALRGRVMDCIVTPSGEAHHPFAMLGPLEDRSELERYRVRQPSLERLEVSVSFRPDVGVDRRAQVRREVSAELRARLGDDIQIELRALEEGSPDFGVKDPLVSGLGLDAEALAQLRVHL